MVADETILMRTPLAMRKVSTRALFDLPRSLADLGFCGDLGTPQVDVSSPATWVAVFYILLPGLGTRTVWAVKINSLETFPPAPAGHRNVGARSFSLCSHPCPRFFFFLRKSRRGLFT